MREAARGEALRQVEQEGGQALLGAHGAEQHHDAVVADDLAAHDLVEVVLQGMDFARQDFKAREGDRADLAVLEGDGVAGMVLGADAVEAEQFAGHLETGDLFAPVLDQYVGLEEAAADRVDRVERRARTVEALAALEAATARNQVVEALHFLMIEAERQAQLAQVATRAGSLDQRQ